MILLIKCDGHVEQDIYNMYIAWKLKIYINV